MNRYRFILLEIILPLVFAGGLYLVFRSSDTVVYQLTSLVGLSGIVDLFRSFIRVSAFPEWFVYSLPGGLWLLAFQNTISLLKKFTGETLVPLVLLASLMGIGLEFLQYFNFTDGRFDLVDLSFYIGAMLLALTNVWLVKNKWELYAEGETSSSALVGVLFVAFTFIIYLADII